MLVSVAGNFVVVFIFCWFVLGKIKEAACCGGFFYKNKTLYLTDQ